MKFALPRSFTDGKVSRSGRQSRRFWRADGRRIAAEKGLTVMSHAEDMDLSALDYRLAENLETVRLAKEFLGRGVVGADLAGAEGIVPLQSFHPVFDLARELGVPATCHAGDSQGPDTVRDALSFGVRRIGHGHHIYDEPSLWEPAIARGVTLEICPTSNIQCHTQPSYREHPAKKLLDAGLRLCISTDNMTLAAVSLADEYRHCVEDMGLTPEDLGKMLVFAAEAAFLPEEKKQKLVARVREALS